jgi:hypothetical protein
MRGPSGGYQSAAWLPAAAADGGHRDRRLTRRPVRAPCRGVGDDLREPGAVDVDDGDARVVVERQLLAIRRPRQCFNVRRGQHEMDVVAVAVEDVDAVAVADGDLVLDRRPGRVGDERRGCRVGAHADRRDLGQARPVGVRDPDLPRVVVAEDDLCLVVTPRLRAEVYAEVARVEQDLAVSGGRVDGH